MEITKRLPHDFVKLLPKGIIRPMDDEEPQFADCHAAVAGILQCLESLADEADSLHMARTHLALRKAIRACQAEQSRRDLPLRARTRRYLTLH